MSSIEASSSSSSSSPSPSARPTTRSRAKISDLLLPPLDHTFTRAVFVQAPNPSAHGIEWGLAHLYRSSQTVPSLNQLRVQLNTLTLKLSECRTMCIPNVPAYLSPSDLIGFIGTAEKVGLSHVRLMKKDGEQTYMALLKFQTPSAATTWRSKNTGMQFSSLRPELCRVYPIQVVTFHSSETSIPPLSMPTSAGDPFFLGFQAEGLPSRKATRNSESSSAAAEKSHETSGPDVPTCPVCLDPMDGNSQVVTIVCQHTFHSACLEKWTGNSCPVCRYTQNSSSDLRTRLGSASGHECSVCKSQANLWICLLCNNVGCGRYDSAHAFSHYEETGHSYSMDIGTQAVWDYIGDGYVHRLIHNKEIDEGAQTGEYESSSKQKLTALGAEMVPREKLDAMSSEYTYLLSSQLHNQRLFFEEELRTIDDQGKKAARLLEQKTREMEKLSREFTILSTELDDRKKELEAASSQVDKRARRCEELEARAKRAEKARDEEKAINKMLLGKLKTLQAVQGGELEKAKKEWAIERAALLDEIRDLSVFISAGSKIQAIDSESRKEISEGTIKVGLSTTSGKKKRPKKKKKPASSAQGPDEETGLSVQGEEAAPVQESSNSRGQPALRKEFSLKSNDDELYE